MGCQAFVREKLVVVVQKWIRASRATTIDSFNSIGGARVSLKPSLLLFSLSFERVYQCLLCICHGLPLYTK